MRILIHQPRLSYFIGGGETVPLKQAEFLSKLGHTIEILTSKPPLYSTIYQEFKTKNKNIKVYELELDNNQKQIYSEKPGSDWTRWDKEALFFGQQSFKFYSTVTTEYDLVIAHLLSDSLFVPKKYTNVLHLHGVPSEKRSFDEIFLNRPNKFVAVSESVKSGWIDLYPMLNKKRIDVCYNGIDANHFINKNQHRDIDLLYVGRLLAHKGIYNIIEAIKILKDNKVNFSKLIMVGSGPELDNLRARIDNLGLNKNIELRDSVNDNELLNLYNRSNIFLCPSYAKEGVLTTMLEAAACGCAIITANACGMPEFAKHNKNSLLSRPNDSSSLADMISSLLEDKMLRENLTQNATTDIKNNWDIQNTLLKLSNLYEAYTK